VETKPTKNKKMAKKMVEVEKAFEGIEMEIKIEQKACKLPR